MFKLALAASFLLFSSSTFAQERASDVPTVVVPAERAVLWPYRMLAAGLTAFERHRDLSPSGQLRFKLRARGEGGDAGADTAGISLGLVGDGWEAPIPVHADGRFTLAQSDRAERDDAQLVISGRREQYDTTNSPRVEIRSPGLAANTMRMGDVRLECQVNQAIAKKFLGVMTTMAINALGGTDWCNPRKDNAGYTVTPRLPFTGAVLVEGERRVTLYEGEPRLAHTLPIYDTTWSNEARIEFRAP